MAEVIGWVLGAVICMVVPLGLAGAGAEDSQNGATGVEAMTETAVTVRDRAKQIVRSIERIERQLIRWWTPLRITGAAVLVFAFLVGTLGYLNERELLYLTETAKQILKYLSANVSTELASIAITILFVDMLYQHRETEREKGRLILQMGSPDNAFAVEAVRALQSHGWLRDGSLKMANLRSANLQGADLGGANLQRTDLMHANLQEAKLGNANLQGAMLWKANLQGAHLYGANLQGAGLFGTNLQGAFLFQANLQRVRYNNATTWPEGFTPPPEAVNVDAETNIED